MAILRTVPQIDKNVRTNKEEIDFNLLATLGIPYGGILNNTSAKVNGTAYYDQTGKKIYKCIENTNLNYADAMYFEAISNNDLGEKHKIRESIYGTAPNRVVSFLRSGNVVTVLIDSFLSGFAIEEKVPIPLGFRPFITHSEGGFGAVMSSGVALQEGTFRIKGQEIVAFGKIPGDCLATTSWITKDK